MSSDADMKQRCKEAQISVSHTRRGEITPDKKSKLTKGSRKRKRLAKRKFQIYQKF